MGPTVRIPIHISLHNVANCLPFDSGDGWNTSPYTSASPTALLGVTNPYISNASLWMWRLVASRSDIKHQRRSLHRQKQILTTKFHGYSACAFPVPSRTVTAEHSRSVYDRNWVASATFSTSRTERVWNPSACDSRFMITHLLLCSGVCDSVVV